MNLGPFLKSLLLILQLNEFLGPKQLCFIIDDEDQSLLHALNVLENLGNNFVGVITCERLAAFLIMFSFATLVTTISFMK